MVVKKIHVNLILGSEKFLFNKFIYGSPLLRDTIDEFINKLCV